MDRTGLLMIVFAAATLAAYFLASPSREAAQIANRVHKVRRGGDIPDDIANEELAKPFSERVVAPIFNTIAGAAERMLPSTMFTRLKSRIIEAGRPCSMERFVTMKLLASATMLAVYVMLVIPRTAAARRPMTMLMAIVASLLAFNLPDLWLTNKTDERKSLVRRYLPDVLDLLTVSVEAGLGFDGAIQKVSEKFREPISGEFKAYLAEVRLGKSRAEALRNLARRNSLPEMQAFTASIIQADQLGVSIATVLRTQSDSLRIRRKQHAEERAQQAPVKMLFPLIIFIFPTLFFVLLGPVAIHWMTTFRSIGR